MPLGSPKALITRFSGENKMSGFVGAGAGVGAAGGAGIGAAIGSIIPGLGTAIGAGIGALVGGVGGGIEGANLNRQLANGPNATTPQITTPPTSGTGAPPSPALASTTALQSQLSSEQNARTTGSVLTAPAGLTDEPTTTSSLLTGS